MLMYTFLIAFGINLIALIMAINMCACCHKGTEATGGSKCRKICGIIIAILAILSLACCVKTYVMDWKHGAFKEHTKVMSFDLEMAPVSTATEHTTGNAAEKPAEHQ